MFSNKTPVPWSIRVICTLFAGLLITAAPAQDTRMTSREQKTVINRICELLPENYLFLGKADQMVEFLTGELKAGRYDSLQNRIEFAAMLTDDLRRISNDSHLRVHYSATSSRDESTESMRWRRRTRDRYFNFGFQRVERLDGNIAYIKMLEFAKELSGRHIAEAVMGSIRHTDAVILDLRDNNGGSPRMVRLIASYFFDDRPVHLFNHVFRDSSNTQEFWTLAEVRGQRMPDVPLYILINRLTFSAAEEFAFCMQRLRRATVIGEKTSGGANVGSREYINEYFDIFIPYGQVLDPVHGDNWDEDGITPDVEVPSEEALITAKILALKYLLKEDRGNLFTLQREWLLEGLTGAAVATPDSLEATEFVGQFEEWEVFLRDEVLFGRKHQFPARELIAVGSDRFMLRGIESFRLHYERNSFNQIVAIRGNHADGRTQRFEKSSPPGTPAPPD